MYHFRPDPGRKPYGYQLERKEFYDDVRKVGVPAELPVSGIELPLEQVAGVTISLGATLIIFGVYVRRREQNKVA